MEVPKFGSFKARKKTLLLEQEQEQDKTSTKEQEKTTERGNSQRPEKRHRSKDRDGERDHHRRQERQDRDHRRHRDVPDDRERVSGSQHERHRARDVDLSLDPALHGSRRHEMSSRIDESQESNIFIIDRRGDSKNVEYGSLHRYSVPAYRRSGYGHLIGRSLALKIDREASNEKEIFLVSSRPEKQAHRKSFKLLSSKYGRDSENRLKFVSAVAVDVGEAETDFIQLSLSRKRKHGSESPDSDMGVDYRSIEGKAKASNKLADADVEYASDSDNAEHNDLDLRARQTSAILSKKAKADPSVLETWLELADHQSQLVRPGTEPSSLTTSERTTLAELRLSILNEAGKTISQGKPGREPLLLATIEEGTPLWDRTKLAGKWKDVLKECPASILIWTRYMNFVQYDYSSFQYETCKEAYMNWLQVLKTAHESSSGDARDQVSATQIYALLRLTTFVRDAGYDELATAIWQVLLEFHFSLPKELETSSVEARLESLEDYWDIETPRIGEEGTMTWAKFHEDGPSDATRRTPAQSPCTSIDPRNPFTSVAREEANLAKVFLLPASTEDQDAITDPFRCIMFDDLRAVVESLSMELPKAGLTGAFLQYVGLPPLPHGYSSAGDWSTDPYLASGSGLTKMRSQRETTFSLFENAFQNFHSRYGSGSDPFARFIDRTIETLLRSSTDEDCSIREYFLAFKARLFPQEAPKTAKKLLKGCSTSLRLYNAYALIEAHAGRMDKAMGVWDAALGMLPKLDDKAQNDAVLLWHSRLMMQIGQGNEAGALVTLLSVANCGTAIELTDESSSHISQLRLRRQLEADFDRMLLSENHSYAVLCADLLAWLTYLTQDITAAITGYRHHITTLTRSGASSAVEDLQQCKARMMALHIDRQRPYKPSALQHEVVTALERFPSNSVLLELHSRIAFQDRLRNLVSEQKRSGTDDLSAVQWSFKLHAEISRVEDAVAGGGTASTVRAAAAAALLNPRSHVAHSVALWKAWLNFEIGRGDSRRARAIFLDGLRALPGVKGWVVQGLSEGVLGEGEMRRVWEGCVERGLRLMVGVEEYL